MFRLLLDTALKTVTYRWQVIKIVETLVHRQIRLLIPIKEGIEFDGQQDLRTKVMIAAGSYVVFQHQSGRSPYLRYHPCGMRADMNSPNGAVKLTDLWTYSSP